jgi:hypothetical protein
MKPFQKAVEFVLVAVALVLGYATLASAASTPHCKVSETAANGTVPLQWTVMATTSATEPNGNSALVSGTPIRIAEGLNAGVQVLRTGTDLASADPDDDGLIDGDDDGTDPMDDDADGDGLDGGDSEF